MSRITSRCVPSSGPRIWPRAVPKRTSTKLEAADTIQCLHLSGHPQLGGVRQASPLQKWHLSGWALSHTVQSGVSWPFHHPPPGMRVSARHTSLHHPPVSLPQTTHGTLSPMRFPAIPALPLGGLTRLGCPSGSCRVDWVCCIRPFPCACCTCSGAPSCCCILGSPGVCAVGLVGVLVLAPCSP